MMNRRLHRDACGLAELISRGQVVAPGLRHPTSRARPIGIGRRFASLPTSGRRQRRGNLKGNVRFLVGPWSDGEVDHHKHIAEGFNALHPDVTFEFRLYQWDTAAQEISTSVAEGAHDIYMTTESSYPDYRGRQRLRGPDRADQRSELRRGEGEVSLLGSDLRATGPSCWACRSAGMSRTRSSSTWIRSTPPATTRPSSTNGTPSTIASPR